jgi:acyl carrier protein
MALDWQALSRFLPGSQSPRFSEIAQTSGEKGHDDDRTRDIYLLMNELSGEAFLDELIKILQAEIGGILRIPPQKIDPLAPFTDMGLDSLMGVELVAAMESRFDIRLSAMALRDSRNLTRLAHTIFDRLKGRGVKKNSDDPSGTRQQIQLLSERHGVDTSQEEAEKLATRIERNRRIRSIIE